MKKKIVAYPFNGLLQKGDRFYRHFFSTQGEKYERTQINRIYKRNKIPFKIPITTGLHENGIDTVLFVTRTE